MFSPKASYPVHTVWWFWLPLLLAAAAAAVNITMGKAVSDFLYAENGFFECLQPVICLAAVVFGLLCIKKTKSNWLRLWFAAAVLGCLYIGLEEISYGQQILKWNTPEYWAALNDQNETNLHNTSSWLDQKPRAILFIGVIVGGILLPLVRRFRPKLLPKKFAAIYPPDALFWTSAMAIFADVAKALHKAEILTVYTRAAEVNETYIYYFILLYLVFFWKTAKA